MNEHELRDWLKNLHLEMMQTNSQFPKNLAAGWPIPFFGDVLSARVLTVGVNPSDREFNPTRGWHQVSDLEQWQARLLGYFQNDQVRPWVWFETWSICLALLDLSYISGAAHLDISPRPTTPMLAPVTNQSEFRRMAEQDVKWFFALLNQLPQVQLLLVAGPIPRGDGRKQQLAEFIRETSSLHGARWEEAKPLPRLFTETHPQGLPVFTCQFEPEVHGLYSMVRQVNEHRETLRRLVTPPQGLTSIPTARLDWPSAIGNFLLSFGTLEYFVFVFLTDHLPEEEFGKVKDWHLKDRLTRMAAFLKESHRPPADQTAFANLVARVEPMRELRNHVAHAQMHLRIDPETGEAAVTLVKAKEADDSSLAQTRKLGFEELEHALTTMSGLNREFERLAGFKTE